MAVLRQSGMSEGKVMTTRGLRDKRPPECDKCRERKEYHIYSRDPNGKFLCEDCIGPRQKKMLEGTRVDDQS